MKLDVASGCGSMDIRCEAVFYIGDMLENDFFVAWFIEDEE